MLRSLHADQPLGRGVKAATALLLISLGSPAVSHDFADISDEAEAEFVTLNGEGSGLTGSARDEYFKSSAEFLQKRVNEHFNTDWHEVDGVLDAYLNLVANCPLPKVFCDDWERSRYREYEQFGASFVSLRLLAEAVPLLEGPLVHRCEEPKRSFVASAIFPTETRHLVLVTKESDAAYPCYIKPLGEAE